MNVPFPPFPTHFPCQKQSVASVSQETPPLLRYWGISLPTFSLPTFPYPRFLSEAVSGVWFARISSTAEFASVSLPTFPCPPSPIHFPYFDCFPAHFSLPTFPVRSSQWRLIRNNLLHCWVFECFPAHLSLPTSSYTFSLFRLFPCPHFILPPLMIPCCLYKMLQWRIMYELFKWTEQPDYFLYTVCVPPPWLVYSFLMHSLCPTPWLGQLLNEPSANQLSNFWMSPCQSSKQLLNEPPANQVSNFWMSPLPIK
jgi:hypothetical protein